MFQVDKQFSNANIPRTVRFTDKLFQELVSRAKENAVSFNLLVLQCCQYSLDHLEQGNPDTRK